MEKVMRTVREIKILQKVDEGDHFGTFFGMPQMVKLMSNLYGARKLVFTVAIGTVLPLFWFFLRGVKVILRDPVRLLLTK